MNYTITVRAADRDTAKQAVADALEEHDSNKRATIDWTPVTTAAGIMIDCLDDKPLDVLVVVTGDISVEGDPTHHARVFIDAVLADRIG